MANGPEWKKKKLSNDPEIVFDALLIIPTHTNAKAPVWMLNLCTSKRDALTEIQIKIKNLLAQ